MTTKSNTVLPAVSQRCDISKGAVLLLKELNLFSNFQRCRSPQKASMAHWLRIYAQCDYARMLLPIGGHKSVNNEANFFINSLIR